MVKSLMILGTVLAVIGCSSDTTSAEEEASTPENPVTVSISMLPQHVQDAINGPLSVLSEELTNTLSYMGNEERLAYDVYNTLYDQYGTKQFTKIATNGEYQHITAVQALVQKYRFNDDVSFTNVDLPALGYQNTAIEDMEAGTYDISIIQKLYDDLVAQGSTSEIDALKVGCIIEVVDVNDLNKDISLAENESASDIVTVFNFLRDGSYSHYWSFDDGLKNKGVTDGCCSLGEEYCQPDYPKK